MSYFRKKSLQSIIDNTKTGGLKRTLSVFDLFLMGIGAIVGTGIFVITGITAAEMSGPAVILSYLFSGIVCIFVAFAYTEVASMIPTSGSVYAYTYVSIGEIMAWIVGWMTMMYLVISAATVSSGWSGYVVSFLSDLDVHLPKKLVSIPSEGGIINLPAVIIALLATAMLIRGTKESIKLNSILVLVKILAIALFIFIAAPHFDIQNWFKHFVDYDTTKAGSSDFMPYGYSGIASGAALVFFGYNGFDTLATATEEAKNPEKDISIAIIGSILVCMVLYMLVSGILVGIVPYNELGVSSPLALSLSKVGSSLGSAIVASGAFAGMTTVILLQIYAQSRMLFVMSRDGLLPPCFAKIHDKYKTPYISTLVVGCFVAIISGFAPLNLMGSLASLGALFSYTIVSIVMLILRKKMPDVKRPFKCPAAYIVASLAIIMCLGLMFTLLNKVGIYFLSWLFIGIVIYIFYANKRSHLVTEAAK